MRPNEVVQMRITDIDMSAKTWTYTPRKHKTQHHDIERYIPLGPKAQQIVAPFLVRRKLTAALFSPAEAEQWMRDKRRAERKTPESCGNTPGSNRKQDPKRKPGAFYTVGSVRLAVTRACKKAGVPGWTPRQLRKTFATEVRRDYGAEAVKLLLGHTGTGLIELYSDRDKGKAHDIASCVIKELLTKRLPGERDERLPVRQVGRPRRIAGGPWGGTTWNITTAGHGLGRWTDEPQPHTRRRQEQGGGVAVEQVSEASGGHRVLPYQRKISGRAGESPPAP